MEGEFSKRVENNVGKEEIALTDSPLAIVFSKNLYCRHIKTRLVLEGLRQKV